MVGSRRLLGGCLLPAMISLIPTASRAEIVHADCNVVERCFVTGNTCNLPRKYVRLQAVIDVDLSTWKEHWTLDDGSTEDTSGVMHRISGYSYEFTQKDYGGTHPGTTETLLRVKKSYSYPAYVTKNGIEALLLTTGDCTLD